MADPTYVNVAESDFRARTHANRRVIHGASLEEVSHQNGVARNH